VSELFLPSSLSAFAFTAVVQDLLHFIPSCFSIVHSFLCHPVVFLVRLLISKHPQPPFNLSNRDTRQPNFLKPLDARTSEGRSFKHRALLDLLGVSNGSRSRSGILETLFGSCTPAR
jgi:hypothetical protein